MKQQFHYATVTEAIEQLKKQGFTVDLNLKENHLIAGEHTYPADEFEIVDLYRYEGASDPADEATVYALANPSGVKGILVSGYGISVDEASTETLKQLHYKYLEGKK
ncbi:phosphoribosylpyrophosphate synthetase [uncultured Mucilaginibacter sp.]|uniref:phosphoribosylpyrophosphate synthetase n=1 Tax=uncultured Mucilaginibacter sp. TaxID=797541 RepID=UPI0025D4FF3D|nr:phosphoribosylpyrophosphate synthetase [uncultured Mucilaginibacter sp.]